MKSIILILSSFLSASVIAAENEGLAQPTQSLVRYPIQKPRLARVRMLMILTEYKKFLVRNNYSKLSEVYRPIQPRKHHLRARIESTNHFYIGNWHIETIPLRWSRKKKQLAMKVNFYKVYGNERNLEESIGSTEITGTLEGGNFLYSFKGSKKIKFANVMGSPIAEIEIAPPQEPQNAISKGLSTKASKNKL